MNAILRDAYHITDPVYNYVKACEDKLQGLFLEHQRIREYNQLKVIRAFQENRLASYDAIEEKSIGGTTNKDSKEEFAVVVMQAKYELKNITYTLSFTKQMKLAGLFLK
jgi:cystathionine beta-lyase family protein involved in aluminum resistance